MAKKTNLEDTTEAVVVKKEAKKQTLEQQMTQLETLIQKMEGGEVSLEESFRLYKEGMKLLKECNKTVDKIEKELLVLESEGVEV